MHGDDKAQCDLNLHKDLLNNPDDVKLFTQGGCGVFAQALHQNFGYPLHLLMGSGGSGISHVCCIKKVNGKVYAVDVIGTKDFDPRVFNDFGCVHHRPIDLSELLSFYVPAGTEGLLNEPWFVEGATQRARLRVNSFLPYYDGTLLLPVPPSRSRENT